MDEKLILFILLVVGVSAWLVSRWMEERSVAKYNATKASTLHQAAAKHSFRISKSVDTGFAALSINASGDELLVVQRQNLRVTGSSSIKARDIVEVQLLEGGIVTASAKKKKGPMVAGGVVAGVVGAGLGLAATPSKQISQTGGLALLIVTTNPANPTQTVTFLQAGTVKPALYESRLADARHWYGVVKSMMARASDQERETGHEAGSPVGQSPSTKSVSDELTKLARLRDEGVLTQAEFENEKRKLLGGPIPP